MSNLQTKSLILYIFLILIIGVIINIGILYLSLNKLHNLNEKVAITTEAKNSFLEVKLETERLLTTKDFIKSKENWINTIENFEKNLKLLSKDQQNIFADSWYISKKEIANINDILQKDIITPHALQEKSISMLRGEMFALNENTEFYRIILSLVNKIEFLMQYEDFIFEDFIQIQDSVKNDIDNQITRLIQNTIFFMFITLALTFVLIMILNKKILKIEKKLLNSQNKLERNFIKLKESKLLLQVVIDAVPVSIFWKDIDGKYMGLNKTFLDNTEYKSVDEIIGKTDFDMPCKKSDAKAHIEDDYEVIRTGEAKLQMEESITKENGEIVHIITSKVPLKNIENRMVGMLGVFMDITETKKVHNELIMKDKLLAQQSKMATMGEMIENIAHQWRQPLSLISSSASGLDLKKEYDMLDDEYFNESIKHIIESTKYLDQTIDDFRNYFRKDKELKAFKISEPVERALLLATSKLRNKSINLLKNLSDTEALGLENEFTQVIINIINNAIDVLDEKELDTKIISIEAIKIDNNIQLSIQDNAGGIPSDIIDNIFEPYFTTKGPQKGTGIGLFMAKDMIEKNMNGTLKVINNEFEYEDKKFTGAKFILTLPSV